MFLFSVHRIFILNILKDSDMEQRNFRNALSDLIGTGGLQATVNITVDAETLLYLSAAMIGSFIIAGIATHYILKVTK